ncbi:ParB/RepB/Spo0J family partition protein [Corynebacterium freiburgense]|uniref:ParB/RepB/Spo0J family partition protein n=1 Tax=Corynebacterium freiburgense TaxID=556548 RepID=UPI00042334DE|nr:ParB/RepB/Spo0J family partition protein [Corynebacterium freiburgense]WJZ03979.1 putative chromosome-partitioning protein ParB [Corynebacterium freiburgense]
MAQEPRKSGLGRGLAALIPSTPAQGPKLGDGAADIIIGGGARPQKSKVKPAQTARPEKVKTVTEANAEKSKAEQAVEKTPQTVSEFGASYQEVPISEIAPNPRQPRQVFDEDALGELVHSIREFGLMQPIVVRRSPADDGFEIIMGERRWRAAAKAGMKKIPAIIRETDDGSLLRDALLENIHRVQLNPLEEAAAYQQLLEEFGVTQSELADRIGRSRPVITNAIRLLALPVKVQSRVAAGVLSAGHARALLGLKQGVDAQEALADRIVAEGLSVRATEEAVMLANRGEQQEKKQAVKRVTPEFFTRAADRLADGLDTKVTVTMGKRKGRIVVEFGDRDDFERIMGLIDRE